MINTLLIIIHSILKVMARTLNPEETKRLALDLQEKGRMEYYSYFVYSHEKEKGTRSVREICGFAQVHEDLILIGENGDTKEIKSGSWLLISEPDRVFEKHHPTWDKFYEHWARVNIQGIFL